MEMLERVAADAAVGGWPGLSRPYVPQLTSLLLDERTALFHLCLICPWRKPNI